MTSNVDPEEPCQDFILFAKTWPLRKHTYSNIEKRRGTKQADCFRSNPINCVMCFMY